MNNVCIISGEKKDNNIHLITNNNFLITFKIFNNDSVDKIIEELYNENIIIDNLNFLQHLLNIFVKKNNRISKMEILR